MPPQRMRRKRRHERSRTSSQSSVEIQVTQTEVTADSTSPAQCVQNQVQPALVKPGREFLRVLKSVNARGSWFAGTEVFSIKQLCHYLTEYIKQKELYDPFNPLEVYCRDDPLGSIFGVEKFSKHEALKHVLGQCEQVVSSHKQSEKIQESLQLPSTIENGVEIVQDAPLLTTVSRQTDNTFLMPSPQPGSRQLDRSVYNISPSFGSLAPVDQVKQYRKRRKCESRSAESSLQNKSSPEAGTSTQRYSPDALHQRVRQSSFSIVYNSDDGRGGSSPWALTFELVDSGDESVLSIQSKDTALAQDSTDDFWFLTDEDDAGGFSVAMDETGISFEFGGTSTDPPFAEEYEVDENSGAETGPEYDTDGSESPLEEIYVVYDASDEDFWADSESSDCESDNTTDDELGAEDNWQCSKCDMYNNPLHRYCDKCWTVRPDWLTEEMTTGKSSSSRGIETKDYFCLAERSKDKNEDVEDIGIGIAEHNACGRLKRSESSSTLPACDIDLSQLEELITDENDSRNTNGNYLGLSKSKDAITNLGYDTPKLRRQYDSGIGGSISSLSGLESSLNKSHNSGYDSIFQSLNQQETLGKDMLTLSHNVTGTENPEKTDLQDITCGAKDMKVINISTSEGVDQVYSCIVNKNNECQIDTAFLNNNTEKDKDVCSIVSDLSESRNLLKQEYTDQSCSSAFQPIAKVSVPPDIKMHTYHSTQNKLQCPPIKIDCFNADASTMKNTVLSNQLLESNVTKSTTECSLIKNPSLYETTTINGPTTSTTRNLDNKLSENPNQSRSTSAKNSPHKSSPLKSSDNQQQQAIQDLCLVCMVKPKEASIIHGKTGHQVCCYVCAKRLRRKGKPCPVCRRPIQKVIKNYLV